MSLRGKSVGQVAKGDRKQPAEKNKIVSAAKKSATPMVDAKNTKKTGGKATHTPKRAMGAAPKTNVVMFP